MNKLKFAFVAFFFAALGRTISLLIDPTFVDSTAAHAVLDGLFVGATVYIGFKVFKRTGDTQ